MIGKVLDALQITCIGGAGGEHCPLADFGGKFCELIGEKRSGKEALGAEGVKGFAEGDSGRESK